MRRAAGPVWLQIIWVSTWCQLSIQGRAALPLSTQVLAAFNSSPPFRVRARASPAGEAWFEEWRRTSLYAECAFLVHASDRPSSRRFWNFTLASTVAFVPVQICSAWYFTYDYDELPGLVAQIEPQLRPHLIRRGDLLAHNRSHSSRRSLRTSRHPSHEAPPSWWNTWSGAIQLDLAQVKEKWIFHIMDDTLFPGPIEAATLASILRAADGLRASYINLHESTWHRCMKSGQVMRRLKPELHAEARLADLQETHAIELWLAGECSTPRAKPQCTHPDPPPNPR